MATDKRIRPDDKGKTHFTLTDRSEFHAIGRKGDITGKGCNLLICDDLVKNKIEADSDATRAEIEGFYNTVATTRLDDDDAKILFLITRWRKNDIAGYVIDRSEEEDLDDWTIVRIPALAEEDEEWEGCFGRRYIRKKGEPVWKAKFSRARLKKIQIQLANEFTGLYQQRPSAIEGEIFKRKDWRFYNREDLPEGDDLKITLISLDTAFKEEETSDYSVGLAAKVGMNGNLYITGMFRDKLEFNPLKNYSIGFIEEHKPDWTLIEDKASGQSLIQELRIDETASMITGIDAMPKKYHKRDYAQACKAMVQRHKIFLPREIDFIDDKYFQHEDWVQDFLEELSEFPNGTYDDIVDAFTQLVMFCRTHHHFENWEEEPEEDDTDEASGIIALA